MELLRAIENCLACQIWHAHRRLPTPGLMGLVSWCDVFQCELLAVHFPDMMQYLFLLNLNVCLLCRI